VSTLYHQYLTTLRRIPKDIVLATATRELEMDNGRACLVAWAVREQLAAFVGVAAEHVDPFGTVAGPWPYGVIGQGQCEWFPDGKAHLLFGGTRREWRRLYENAAYDKRVPLIERAFVQRVSECAR
jgi:hypothetical protein